MLEALLLVIFRVELRRIILLELELDVVTWAMFLSSDQLF